MSAAEAGKQRGRDASAADRRSPRHILVTGSNRSGTTWVGSTLALAKGIGYLYEPFATKNRFVKGDIPKLHHFHYVVPEQQDAIKQYLDNSLSRFPLSFTKELRAAPTLVGLLRASYHQAGQLLNALRFPDRFILKDPLALMSAAWLYRVYQCDVVVLIRHPAAYVASIKRMGWRSDPSALLRQYALIADYLSPLQSDLQQFHASDDNLLEEACLRWRVYHTVIRELQRRYPHWVYLRHEDLSLDPVSEFERLYSCLGIAWTEAIATQIHAMTNPQNLTDAGDQVHVLSRNSLAVATHWQQQLGADEISYIREQTGALAKTWYADESWSSA